MSNTAQSTSIASLNYVSYTEEPYDQPRIGRWIHDSNAIQPLAFASGTPITDLYQVIEAGESQITASGNLVAIDQVKLLPPITGRDILAVGLNYVNHLKEFNSSGFGGSDKADRPSHPVIFTKRFTSVIAHGEEIIAHPEFTQTPDFEGEVGVIVKKAGYKIKEEDAWDYVWGYTIINDMTARERQRDHKQYYIGKSPDTFCPMGPIAVPATELPRTLSVQTHINGELRQNATTDDLIFSIPQLIKALSEGQTLLPGDVLATGTPAGVGIGRNPPEYLRPGDEVAITIPGLGCLKNRVAQHSTANLTMSRYMKMSAIHASNAAKSVGGSGLTRINGKRLHYRQSGLPYGPHIVFVHGLAGTVDYWTPFTSAAKLAPSYSLHAYDLEGQGLSPTSPLSKISISSLAADLNGIFEYAQIQSDATVIAHSYGCLPAISFAISHPEKVKKLILMGPPEIPLPVSSYDEFSQIAAMIRKKGILPFEHRFTSDMISKATRESNYLALAAMRISLLGQDPEGFARFCSAVAESGSVAMDLSKLKTKTLIITGAEDVTSPPDSCRKFADTIPDCSGMEILDNVGHWHVFEDVKGVVDATAKFLKL